MSNQVSEAKTVLTQWGSQARAFSDYSLSEKQEVLHSISDLLKEIKGEIGVDCFLSYGALLGAVRQGSLIGHDFDIDVVFLAPDASPETVVRTSQRLVAFLIDKGFQTELESNGQFKAHWVSSTGNKTVEFFVGWIEDDRFFQYFAIQGAPIADAVLPLASVTVEGVSFPAPRRAEVLLETIYGREWRVPDPNFRYQLNANDWIPFSFLFSKKNRNFWNEYYGNKEKNRVFVQEPSEFALLVSKDLVSGRLVDVGCGNGRDGLFFASKGMKTTLADYSEAALEYCRDRARLQGVEVKLEQLNLSDIADVYRFRKENYGHYDVLYSRFFLHAINEVGQVNFFDLALDILTPGGCAYLEYRCIDPRRPEKDLRYENGVHYRRLIDQDELIRYSRRLNFDVVSDERGYGLAVYKSEDPFIGRLVLRKQNN